MYEKLDGQLKEVYFGDSIVINSKLPKSEQRELIAHAIGHHLLHAGNHLAMQKRVYSFGNYHEKQANIFAACLLMPKDEFEKTLRLRLGVHEAADHFEVGEDLVKLRVKIWKSFERPAARQQAAEHLREKAVN